MDKITGIHEFGTDRRYFYRNRFAAEAIKHNFAEGDPRRDVLMKHVDVELDWEPTPTMRWYDNNYDLDTKFDPEVLEPLKVPLTILAEDLQKVESRRAKCTGSGQVRTRGSFW